jgi:hypothetical protein
MTTRLGGLTGNGSVVAAATLIPARVAADLFVADFFVAVRFVGDFRKTVLNFSEPATPGRRAAPDVFAAAVRIRLVSILGGRMVAPVAIRQHRERATLGRWERRNQPDSTSNRQVRMSAKFY